MNRQIKFKGLRTDGGGWVEGCLIINNFNGKKEMFILEDTTLFYDDSIKVHPETVGQFTGLKDKNGREVFEGDVVTYKRSVGNWTGQTMTTTHEIIFTEEVNAFVMEYGSSYIKLRRHRGYEYEIIGNIHEKTETNE
jgi:uncharacterized phage protein (TIGR01671 family)